MLNAAFCSADIAGGEQIELLDPVAGKGTTLFEGLQCGYNVSGIEIGGSAAREACAHFKKYLEEGRYKHSDRAERISGENKSFRASARYFTFRPDGDNKAVEGKLTMVEGDSRYADRYFRKRSFHLIVGDLPYGVAHGNVTNEKQSSLTRNPSDLLAVCLPAWRAVLKPGGALALAWNDLVLPRDKLTGMLEANGFTVLGGGAYERFAHRVDRSIRRDVIIAKI
jgi:tRNA G10  N-methylase Trm11